MATNCDVLVIGGGPAGLTAANVLSKKDLSVIILEKGNNFGPESTKYDITEDERIRNILDTLEIEPNKTSSKSDWISKEKSYTLKSEIEDYYFKRGPDKDSLEKKLISNSNEENINSFRESEIQEINFENEKYSFIVNSSEGREKINPEYIIDAEGSESYISNELNLSSETFAKFEGLGVILDAQKENEIPHARIYLDKGLAPGGYLYSGSVKEDTFACVVIDSIFSEDVNIEENLKNFIRTQFSEDRKIKSYFSGIGISGRHKPVHKNIIFVGGAALLHGPFLGYGLNYAIESGYKAAQSITRNNLSMYREYFKEMQDEFSKMKSLRKFFRNANNDFFQNLINGMKEPSKIKNGKVKKILKIF